MIDYCGSLDVVQMGLRSSLLLLTLKPKLIMAYLHIVTFIKNKPH